MKGILKSEVKRRLQTKIKNKLKQLSNWKGTLEPKLKRNFQNRNLKGVLQSEFKGNCKL